MGGDARFGEDSYTVRVGDFHRVVNIPEHKYKLVILDDKGAIEETEFNCTEPVYVSVKTKKDARFYRAEVIDLDRDLRIAVGNPIWNID